METRYIYLLRNPETNEGFYIGQTRNLLSRLATHMRVCDNRKHKRDEILCNLKSKGVLPIIEKLEEYVTDGSYLSLDALAKREKYWIAHFKDTYKLFNIEHNTQPTLKSTPTSKNCKRCNAVFYPNKPKQVFCSDVCRVYFKREKDKIVLNTPKIGKDIGNGNIITKIKKHNHSVTLSVNPNIPPMPIKMEGENSLDYAARKNEWKVKYSP